MGERSTDDGRRQKEGAARGRELGGGAEKEDGGDDRAPKRRRLLRGESRLVRTEGEVVREVLGRADFYEDLSCTEELGELAGEEEGSADPPYAITAVEEENYERPVRSDSNRWRVAFRKGSDQPFTDAQWHAYWRQRGYFIDDSMPFPLPWP